VVSVSPAGTLAGPIPLLLLGGFLGAGKTTLVGRWIAEPAFARTAIVVDDSGDTGLDLHLISGGKLPGRACVRGSATQGFAATLRDLARERTRCDVPAFERVIVEMRALDDRLPLLHDLAADGALRELYAVHGIVTAVDALQPATQLEPGGRSRGQAQAADALVITKTDLAHHGEAGRLAGLLARINPDAEILHATPGRAGAGDMWNAVSCAPGRDVRRAQAALAQDAGADQTIGSLHVRFPHAVELSGFCVRLAAFLEAHAGKVLRVKGLVRVEGRGGPAVIQAVGRTLYPVRTLKQWPAGLAESALVVTAAGLADDEIRMAIAAQPASRRSSRTL
jgi:G3E family GTPase